MQEARDACLLRLPTPCADLVGKRIISGMEGTVFQLCILKIMCALTGHPATRLRDPVILLSLDPLES